jgi:hypothetical protein
MTSEGAQIGAEFFSISIRARPGLFHVWASQSHGGVGAERFSPRPGPLARPRLGLYRRHRDWTTHHARVVGGTVMARVPFAVILRLINCSILIQFDEYGRTFARSVPPAEAASAAPTTGQISLACSAAGQNHRRSPYRSLGDGASRQFLESADRKGGAISSKAMSGEHLLRTAGTGTLNLRLGTFRPVSAKSATVRDHLRRCIAGPRRAPSMRNCRASTAT